MADGDGNTNPLFNVKKNGENVTAASEVATAPVVEGAPKPIEEVPVQQPKQSKSLFDVTNPSAQPVKKKEPSVPSPLVSDAGTSALETTPSVAQPKLEPERPAAPTGAELALNTIDFSNLTGHPQDAPAFLPKITPVREALKTGGREVQKMENILRQKVLTDPKVLDLEGADALIAKKVTDATGNDALGSNALEVIQTLRRERDLVSTSSQEPLDVTPDFGSALIVDQLRKANAQFSKQDFLAAGKSEEEAEALSKVLFPEKEISKSVELGININKVKNDYLSFLEKNNPEKLSDIKAAAAVGDTEGQRAMTFMQEALSHQAEVIDAKTIAILSKGEENLTEQDVQTIAQLEDQKRRLGDRYKSVIFDFPEIHEEAVKEKLAQERVDDSYKQAKANALLPGPTGDQARREVLFHQVISPILGASVGLVGDVAQLGINQQRGMSNDDIVAGTSAMMGDWVTKFFDTEKSGSIYKKPSELQGALFENGDLQAEKLVPKVSETLFQMYALLGGGGAAGGALETAGLGAKASQRLGLIASSYTITQNDYFQEAKSLGLSDSES
ncbi:MAG: hypothetical protein ACTSX1_11465, partial [Candidatus Heimdallarchaeaceae archaeon]